jgi:hypothetical protein
VTTEFSEALPTAHQTTKEVTPMNGKTTRSYGEQLAEQIAYFDRLVPETYERHRRIGCYVARHNRRHPDRPVRFIPENMPTAA